MKTILFIATSLCLSLCAQAQFKNDLQREKLKGRVRTVAELTYNGSHDSLMVKSVTRYDNDGNAVEFHTYTPDGTLLSITTFAYDSGKIKEERRYKGDSTLSVRATYQFDAKGNKIEEDDYDASGTLFLKIMCKFNGKGDRLVRDSYNEFGALFLKCNSRYDNEGHETEAKEYDSHHGLKYTTTYDYGDEDKAGNWLKRTTYKNDDPTFVTEREIAYY